MSWIKKFGIKTLLSTVLFVPVPFSHAAITVDFTGGGGTPLQITLPALDFEITDAASLNAHSFFGLAIAVGQIPISNANGFSTGANANDWSSDNPAVEFTTFLGTFAENIDTSDAVDGGIVWYGMQTDMDNLNGDTISYAGGTISNDSNVAANFTDGMYDIYLIRGVGEGIVSEAAVLAVPEPHEYALFAGLSLLGFVFFRKRITQ